MTRPLSEQRAVPTARAVLPRVTLASLALVMLNGGAYADMPPPPPPPPPDDVLGVLPLAVSIAIVGAGLAVLAYKLFSRSRLKN
jgi:hypothetical protein